jgi:hypothetical protein
MQQTQGHSLAKVQIALKTIELLVGMSNPKILNMTPHSAKKREEKALMKSE